MSIPSVIALPITINHRWQVAQTPDDANMVQRRAIDTRKLRDFRCSLRLASSNEMEEIKAQYTASGNFSAFSWTPPGELSAINVVFSDDSLHISRASAAGYNIDFTLREVANP